MIAKLNIKKLAFLTIFFLGTFTSCQIIKPEKKYVIGFSQCTSGDTWRKTMEAEMKREAGFHPALELIIRDAKGNNELQISQIEAFISQKIDLLIVSPNEAAPITPVVEKAFTLGIPVIIVDRRTTSSLYTAYVGADNYKIGYTAGLNFVEELNGKGKIIEI